MFISGSSQAAVQSIAKCSGAYYYGAVVADSTGEVAVGGDDGGRRWIIHVGYFLGDAVVGGVGAAAGGVGQLDKAVMPRREAGHWSAVGHHQRRHSGIGNVLDQADQRAVPVGPPTVGTAPDHIHCVNHNHCG